MTLGDPISDWRPLRPDQTMLTVDWPKLVPVDVPTVGPHSILVVCAGFEDRAVVSLKRVLESGQAGFSVIVIKYLPRYLENQEREIERLLISAGVAFSECIYDRRNPSDIGGAIVRKLHACSNIVVDVSGMSRLLIVQILAAIIPQTCVRLRLVYAEAAKYPPTVLEYQRRRGEVNKPVFLSSGIYEIAVSSELSSVAMVGQPIRLILFPSFDFSQVSNLLLELQPACTHVIHGRPPSEKNAWRTEAIRDLNSDVLDGLRNRIDHEASTICYAKTLDILLNIYSDHSMFDRLVVAPIGSKMQAVAVGLFRAVLTDVQVVYPTPMNFVDPSNYTRGVRQVYEIEFPSLQRILPGSSDWM